MLLRPVRFGDRPVVLQRYSITQIFQISTLRDGLKKDSQIVLPLPHPAAGRERACGDFRFRCRGWRPRQPANLPVPALKERSFAALPQSRQRAAVTAPSKREPIAPPSLRVLVCHPAYPARRITEGVPPLEGLAVPRGKVLGAFFLHPALDRRVLLDYNDLTCGCVRAYTSSRAQHRGPPPVPQTDIFFGGSDEDSSFGLRHGGRGRI